MANSTNLNNPETTTNAQIQGAGLILPPTVNERDANKLSTLLQNFPQQILVLNFY